MEQQTYWAATSTTSFKFEESKDFSRSSSSESLFFSRNSAARYTTSPAKCLTMKWSSFERVSLRETLGAAKTGDLACALWIAAQKVLPDEFGVRHAVSSCA